eukprot:gene8878-827_t
MNQEKKPGEKIIEPPKLDEILEISTSQDIFLETIQLPFNLMKERYDEDFFEKVLERIFNMKETSKLFKHFVQEGEDRISSKIAYSIFQNSDMKDNALNGMATDEMKKYDYFLHIDEVTGDIKKIRDLWESLTTLKLELSKHDIIFDFYLTGKRTLYNKIGLGSNISPSSIEWIIINPLEKKHVQQLVNDEETFPKNISFENDELKNYFINSVHLSSGGIPRLIEFLWISFKKIVEEKLKTKEEVDMIFLRSFKLIELYARDSDKFILDEELKIPALHFYALSIFCNSFKSNEIIKINEEKFEFQDIISILPFYITKEKNELKIIQSFMYKFLKKNYEENLGILFSLTPNLPSNIFVDSSYLFEIFVLNRLISISQLNLKKKISEMNALPFLHHSFVSQLNLDIDIENNLIFLPQVTSKGKSMESKNLQELNNLKTIKKEEISKIIDLIFSVNKTIIGKPRDRSSSADLIIFQSNSYLMEWQMKFGDQEIGFSSINNEVKKSFVMKDIKSVFIMIAMNLSPELNSLIDEKSGFIEFDEGEYYASTNATYFCHYKDNKFCKFLIPKGIISAPEIKDIKLDKKVKLIVPKNLQIIILNKSGLQELLGISNYDIIKLE